ncbi:MAG: hypothetical protein V1799_22095 [bacterium]
MEHKSILKKIVTSPTWSVLSVILALVFFFWDNIYNPFDFRMLIDAEFTLIDVKERVNDLKILYKDYDLIESNKEIRVVTLTMYNKGKNILQESYDQQQPFGLKLNAGIFLGYDVVNSNSDYLNNNILAYQNISITTKKADTHSSSKSSEPDSTILYLSKLIFEKEKFVTLKLYVLRQRDSSLIELTPIGKIANIEKLEISRNRSEEKTTNDFFKNYLIIAILLYMFISPIILRVRSSRKQKIKVNKIHSYISENPNLSIEQLRIIRIYENNWSWRYTEIIQSLLSGEKVIDLRDYIKPELVRLFKIHRIFTNFALYIRRIEFAYLPAEVFTVSNTMVSINKKHREFLMHFFKEMDLIPNKETE